MTRPPLVEVASGIRFHPLEGLSSVQLVHYWQHVRREYPVCEEKPDPRGTSFPVLVLSSEDASRVLQLQREQFVFNWRRQTEQETYPGFQSWSANYRSALATFQQMLKEHGLGALQPVGLELIYVNQFVLNTSLSAGENFRALLPDFSWRYSSTRFLPSPALLNWHTTCILPDYPMSLTIGVKAPVVPMAGPHKGLASIHLDLAARGFAQDGATLEDALEWLDEAHKRVRQGYDDLVVEEYRSDKFDMEEAE